MSKKILLVEDDITLGETVKEILDSENFEVTWVKDGNEALFLDKNFDLLLLDINVPFVNGFNLLKEFRELGDKTPAIFITANVDISSLKKGFDIGADDYIKKPFNFDELLIRISATLKKSLKSYDTSIYYGKLRFNIESEQLFDENKKIHLSPSELNLVKHFLKNIGKPLSKDELIYQTNTEFVGSDNVLRVQISKLNKLGFNISNIRSIGYRLEKL